MNQFLNSNVQENSDESFFGIEELFVSRTDKQSFIINGNNVFVRVSEFQKTEMLGKPHNLIRHPDMPKAVFKLLWSELEKDHVFCGYVKNRSKEGRYYWVVAVVFPTTDGYISVRLKPSTGLHKAAEGLYKEVLEYENQNGMNAALEFMVKRLQELGFPSYEHFMHQVLKSELFSRDEKTVQIENKFEANEKSVRNLNRTERIFNEIQYILDSVVMDFRNASHNTSSFEKLKSVCQESMIAADNVFSKLEGLSINMSIAAHKLGKDGGTLAVVASTFQTTANQALLGFKTFQNMTTAILVEFDTVLFSILSSRALIEMLTFQMKESINNLKNGNFQGEKEQIELSNELHILTEQVQFLFKKNAVIQNAFFEKLLILSKSSSNLTDLITRLDLIRTGGKLEGSRTLAVAESFLPFINEMETFIKAVGPPIAQIVGSASDTVTSMGDLMSKVRLIEHSISEVSLLIELAQENNSSKKNIATAA